MWGILALGLFTAFGLRMGLGTLSAGLLFLLCVVVQALRGDFWSAAIVSTVAAFALAYFFTPPIFSLRVAKPLDAIALLAFVIIALVIAHLAALYRARGKHAIEPEPALPGGAQNMPASQPRGVALLRHVSGALVISAFLLVLYGLAWTYGTERYLKGFADAIVPLEGSPQEKTEALLRWFRHEPGRTGAPLEGPAGRRDPVNAVENARLLKACGGAGNAFINLADVAGLRTRRLLLLAPSGGAMHVVAEVQWGERWVVVDPRLGHVLRDRSGRALTKEELRDPEVFHDAMGRIPGYNPTHTFERTAHIHLRRIPLVGQLLRRALDRFAPGWEEVIDWGYFPEHPSLWPIVISIPLLLLGVLVWLIVECYRRKEVHRLHRLLGENGVPESMESA